MLHLKASSICGEHLRGAPHPPPNPRLSQRGVRVHLAEVLLLSISHRAIRPGDEGRDGRSGLALQQEEKQVGVIQ